MVQYVDSNRGQASPRTKTTIAQTKPPTIQSYKWPHPKLNQVNAHTSPVPAHDTTCKGHVTAMGI